MYSQYKSSYTIKFLIAIASNGLITFVSNCYGGRASDMFITNTCGFLDLLEENDTILADKGFPGIICENKTLIIMPPFVDGKLTVEEIEQTYSIASVRIHVERSIQRLKIYQILKYVTTDLLPHMDNILFVAFVLTHLQSPTINESDD